MTNTTTDQNTEGASGSLSMHTDWWSSGWGQVLPQHQSMLLCMIFGTATVREVEGDLDGIVQQIVGDKPMGLFRGFGESLDSPVAWLDEEDLESADSDEERNEIRSSAAEREATLAGALRAAELPVPTTVRELAQTMIDLKLVAHQDDTWAMPEVLPLAEDTLTLPESIVVNLRKSRHIFFTSPDELPIVHHLIRDLDYPAEVPTSLDQLVTITEGDLEKVRASLGRLVENGDAQLYHGDPRVVVAAKDLPAHQRFYLVPDWETFNENRMTIRRAD